MCCKIVMDIEEYSHHLSNALYFPESFPTDAAAQLYEYDLDGCKCISECRTENQCECLHRSGTYYEFNDASNLLSYKIKEKNENVPSYECNDNCNCTGHTCGNRLIQFGSRKGLEVKKCNNDVKGLGLFTCTGIEKGNFICQYAGEVTTEEEAKQRYKFYQQNNEVNYIFCIREYFGSKLSKTFIDPTIYGNIGRYINHSCEANCKLFIVRINSTIPTLAVFANTNLPVSSEITYDYGMDTHFQDNSQRKRCYCMSNNCRIYLPCDLDLQF